MTIILTGDPEPAKTVIDSLKNYVKLNNSLKEKQSELANTKVGEDPKKWTQQDMNGLADNLQSYEYFYRLMALATASEKTVDGTENGKPTDQAEKARTALEEFSGRPYKDFCKMIIIAATPYSEVLAVRRDASKKFNVDLSVGFLTKDNWVKLDRKKLTTLATTLKDGKLDADALLNFALLSGFSARTQEKDAKDNITKAAIYAQGEFGKLAADGKWQTLNADVKAVKVIVDKKLAEQKKKEEKEKQKNNPVRYAGAEGTETLPGEGTEVKATDAGSNLPVLPVLPDAPALSKADAERIFAEKVQLNDNHTTPALDANAQALAVVQNIRGNVRAA